MPLDPPWRKRKISRMEFTAVVLTSQSREPHPIWGLGKELVVAELIFGNR